ncbi:MAG: hypothetical protein ACKOFP_09805 [Actinomycetota bacterium]
MGALTVRARSHRAAWAWVAIALTPIVLGAGYGLMRLTDGQWPEARLVASVVAAVIVLIPPTAAVVIGFMDGDRISGRVALAVASALLACVGFALMIYVESRVALVMAAYAYAVAMVAVLSLAQAAARRRAPRRTTSPLA